MALPAPSYYFKRGSTFSLAGYASLPTGDDWTATSEIKDQRGTLVQELTVTIEAPVAPETKWPILLFASAEDASVWPLGALNCDIRFDYNGNIVYSPTFVINVIANVTDAPAGAMVIGG